MLKGFRVVPAVVTPGVAALDSLTSLAVASSRDEEVAEKERRSSFQ
jgi:hypothetical protein